MSEIASYNEVFVSYSRKDSEFAKKFVEALYDDVENIWVDWEDINFAEDWWDRICRGIESSSNFVFVISPDSIHSDVCRQEIEYAVASGKRIVPILHRETSEEDNKNLMHPAIQRHNWLPFLDGDDFDDALQKFLELINTDPLHVRNHTQLLTKAREWADSEHDVSRLLGGQILNEAEIWQAQASGRSPTVTKLHGEFIYASRQNQQSNSRRLFAGGGILVVLSLIAMFVAIGFFFDARNNADEARINAEIADANAARAANNLEIADANALKAEENAREAEANEQEARGLTSILYADIAEEEGDFHVIYPLLLQANQLAGDNALVSNSFRQTNANLLIIGGFNSQPDIDSISEENLFFDGAYLSPDRTRIATVHYDYVSEYDQEANSWSSYYRNTIVTFWSFDSNEALQHIVIPTSEIDASAISYNNFVFVDIDFERNLIFVNREDATEYATEDGTSNTIDSYSISAWDVESGTELATVDFNTDGIQTGENQFLTYPQHYPQSFVGTDVRWAISLQSIQEYTEDETLTLSTIIQLNDVQALQNVTTWELPGHVIARVNADDLILVEHDTLMMTLINPETLETAGIVDLQDLTDIEITGLVSLNLIADETQALLIFEHGADNRDALIFDLSDNSLNTFLNTMNWNNRITIADTVSDFIYFPDLQAQFFTTQRYWQDGEGNSFSTTTLNLWSLADGEVLFRETLEEGEDIWTIDYDADLDLLAIIIRKEQEENDRFNLRLYKPGEGFSLVHTRPIRNFPSQLGFSDAGLWWVDGQILIELTENTANNCDTDNEDCAQFFSNERIELPAGLSVIDYDPGEQLLIIHNRNKGYFYLINLNRESDLTVLTAPFDFTRFSSTESIGAISNNRYAVLRYNARNETYGSFVWNLETNPPSYETAYYFEELPPPVYGTAVISEGGERIIGLSNFDFSAENIPADYLDVRFGQEAQNIALDGLFTFVSILDSTESMLITFSVNTEALRSSSLENYYLSLIDLSSDSYDISELLTIPMSDSLINFRFSPDGRHFGYAAIVTEENNQTDEDSSEDEIFTRFWVWEMKNQELIYNPRLTVDLVDFIFAPDAPLIYALQSNGDLLEIDFETGIQRPLGSLNSQETGFGSMIISPDGTKLLIIDGNSFYLWDVATEQSLYLTLFEESEFINNVVFIDDNRVLFEMGTRIVVWDVITTDGISTWVCENRLVLPLSELNVEDLEFYQLDARGRDICS